MLKELLVDKALRPDELALENDDLRYLHEELALLDSRDAFILKERFGFDGQPEKKRTLQEIAKKLGLSRERVRQLEKRAKAVLRSRPGMRRRFAPSHRNGVKT